MTRLTLRESPIPAVPAPGVATLFCKDKNLWLIDSDGNVIKVSRGDLGTLAVQDSDNVSITGGSIDLSGGTLVLGPGQIAWAWVAKTGSSLSDLADVRHSLLSDDEPEKHRVIDDSATSPIKLWSSQKIAAMISGMGSLAYVVGKDTGDPYSSIQAAITQAVTDGASMTTPATVLVKPGAYTENVSLAPGVAVVAVAQGSRGMTLLQGQLEFSAASAGTLEENTASWCGIDVDAGSAGYALDFKGPHTQRLLISESAMRNSSAQACCHVANFGGGSVLLGTNVEFTNAGAGEAVDIAVGAADFTNVKSLAASAAGVAVRVRNASTLRTFYHRALGQVVFSDTSGGLLAHEQIDAGTNAAIKMDSSGSVKVVLPINLGTGSLVGGANPQNVSYSPDASEIPYDNVVSKLVGTNVQAAIDEIAAGNVPIIGQLELDFFEGDNPPYIADIDVFGFKDGAGFPNGADTEVLFKLQPNALRIAKGVTVDLVYALSASDPGKNIRLRLDYVVHNDGESYSAGTPYGQTFDLPTSTAANELARVTAFTIPEGHVSSNTVEVECKLSRLGTDVNDSYSGDFGLKHVVVNS